ncbi:MAG: hypothetical protein M3Q91_11845 [Acidobacteriota bacterium]|nr:hypothetical protein [Acidobacteriota bacterium]
MKFSPASARENNYNGGILNGTTETVYDPAFVFTPDPNVVSYIADLTITTHQGELKTSNVYIYNFVTGLWTAMGNINPGTSTGRSPERQVCFTSMVRPSITVRPSHRTLLGKSALQTINDGKKLATSGYTNSRNL